MTIIITISCATACLYSTIATSQISGNEISSRLRITWSCKTPNYRSLWFSTCLANRLTCHQLDDSIQAMLRNNLELEWNGQPRRCKADFSWKKNDFSLKKNGAYFSWKKNHFSWKENDFSSKKNHFSLKKNDFSLKRNHFSLKKNRSIFL